MSFWHWPDRVIGKRESRQLRDEHNATENRLHDALLQLEKLAYAARQREFNPTGPKDDSRRSNDLWQACLEAESFLTYTKARGT